MKIKKYAAAFLALAMGMSSCDESYLDIEDTSYLDAEAAGVAGGKKPDAFLNAIWSWMVTFDMTGGSAHDDFGYMSVMHSTDMMSEDIAMASNHWFGYDYQHDNRMYNYRRTLADWMTFYSMIDKANAIIGLYPDGGTTVGEKGLLGQAYAVRGLAYYYLIQLYQFPVDAAGNINKSAKGVPLMYTAADGFSEAEMAAKKGRNTLGEVYAQIESDLLKAVESLEGGYVRPNKMFIDLNVANGILARYYLLSQQWEKAAAAAAAAREGYPIMSTKDLYSGFYDLENDEWMWGFNHTTETSTVYASFFSHISNDAPGYSGIGYSTRLIDARLYESIPADDTRKGLFNGAEGDAKAPNAASSKPYAARKFGSDGDWTMDYVYMRASEMVLIEAEAYARLNQGAKAAETLKVLLSVRQPGWDKASVTVADILWQRRVELWGEGFAYFDLKRNNLGIDRNYDGSNHLAGYKLVVPAQDPKWCYQIPQRELNENKLITDADQNE